METDDAGHGLFLRSNSTARPTLAPSRGAPMRRSQLINRALPRCAAGWGSSRFRSSAFPTRDPSTLQIPTVSGEKKGMSPTVLSAGGALSAAHPIRMPRTTPHMWRPGAPSIPTKSAARCWERRRTREGRTGKRIGNDQRSSPMGERSLSRA